VLEQATIKVRIVIRANLIGQKASMRQRFDGDPAQMHLSAV